MKDTAKSTYISENKNIYVQTDIEEKTIMLGDNVVPAFFFLIKRLEHIYIPNCLIDEERL